MPDSGDTVEIKTGPVGMSRGSEADKRAEALRLNLKKRKAQGKATGKKELAGQEDEKSVE